jgi:hypothetical protein
LAVPARFGLPLPMTVLQLISVGLSVDCLALAMAADTAAASLPSIGPITCQP